MLRVRTPAIPVRLRQRRFEDSALLPKHIKTPPLTPPSQGGEPERPLSFHSFTFHFFTFSYALRGLRSQPDSP